MSYLSLLAKHLDADKDRPRIALAHHHPYTYGSDCCSSPLGFALLETLWKKNCKLLFHGHIHMFERGEKNHRPVLPGFAYSIPCTSFSSHTFMMSQGFMIHTIDKNEPQKIATYRWEISPESIFSEELLKLFYMSTINHSGLTVDWL